MDKMLDKVVTATLELNKINELNKGMVPDYHLHDLHIKHDLTIETLRRIRDIIQTEST